MIRRDARAGAPDASTPSTWSLGPLGSGGPGDPTALLRQLDSLGQENERLRDELGRCYQHLGIVFEITEKIAGQRDPSRIEFALIRCYSEMLRADGVVVVDRGEIRRLDEGAAQLDLERIATALDPQIRAASERVRSFCLAGNTPANRGLAGHHALVGTYRTTSGRLAALVALRLPSERPFDTGDQLVSETILAYGGHILNNALMVRRIQQSALETVCAFANAVDARDAYTHGHSERVGWLARAVGARLGLSETDLGYLEWAGILHDVGKIGVPEQVLNKPGRLEPDEFEQIKAHPRLGYEVLRPVSTLEPLLEGVLYHHEDYDGSGYPEGLSGERIPLFARVLRVADTFDALTSTRTYRAGLSLDDALALIERESGASFDPVIAKTFVALLRDLMETRPAAFVQRFGPLLDESGGE